MNIKFEVDREELYEGKTSTIDNFVIKSNGGYNSDSFAEINVSMEKNNQKLSFRIKKWNSNKEITANEIYELFTSIFEK